MQVLENFTQDVAEGRRMYLRELDDWTGAGNPFIDTTEKFMTYYYQNVVRDYFNDGIPITVIKKKKKVSIIEINTKQSFAEAQPYFDISSKKAFQMDKNRSGYTTFEDSHLVRKDDFDAIIGKCDYKARSGVEFTPAEVYFIEPVSPTPDKKSYLFQPSSFKKSKYKSKSKLPIQLETRYIRPVVKAPEILPFGFNDTNEYCIYPYNAGIAVSVEPLELSTQSPKLLEYLTSNRKLIGKQSSQLLTISKGTSFYSLSKVGAYTYAPYQVTFRDNTKMSAAVVQKVKTPWGGRV